MGEYDFSDKNPGFGWNSPLPNWSYKRAWNLIVVKRPENAATKWITKNPMVSLVPLREDT